MVNANRGIKRKKVKESDFVRMVPMCVYIGMKRGREDGIGGRKRKLRSCLWF